MKENAGTGNFMYVAPKDAYTYLQYGFRCQEIAMIFRIIYGG
jgi:hypothetical protein